MNDYTRADGVAQVDMAEGEVLDWSRDWTGMLTEGEAIETSVWSVPTGLVAGLTAQLGACTTQWIESPAPGTYTMDNRVTTSQGRTFVRALVIRVKKRK